MLDSNLIYFNEVNNIELKKKIAKIMGQFLDYIASVFTTTKLGQPNSANTTNKANVSNHVTFADNSFTQAFGRGSETERAAKLNSLRQSNRRTIYTYEFIGLFACLVSFSWVTWPKLQQDTFDIYEPQGWQLVTLNLIPLFIHVASISAMLELNRPIPDGTRLTSKHSGLQLDNNDFVHSLKIFILLIAVCQLSALFSDLLLWSVVMILPFWCYQLTSRLARQEYNRYAPSLKKSQWVKLNISSSKSPKHQTPNKSSSKQDNAQPRTTPRTRTKRAVKNILTGVSDKYHAFEQNFAHQISQKIFTPLSPRAKMIDRGDAE